MAARLINSTDLSVNTMKTLDGLPSPLAAPQAAVNSRRAALAMGLAAITAGTAAQPQAATVASPAVAVSPRKTTLRLVTAWSSKLSGMVDLMERMTKRVSDLSGGSLNIIGQHQDQAGIPALELMGAVASGKIDMAHSSAYYWTKRSAAFNFFATVPFGMMAHEHYAWLHFAGGLVLWKKLAAKFGVEVLPCGNTGVQMGGWFRKVVRNKEDLKGLKVRYPGLGGEIFRRLGATPTMTSAAALLPALKSGELDAAEWVSPWNDLDLGLHTVCKNYYYPGIHEPGHTLELLINPDAWARLSKMNQEVLQAAAALEFGDMQAQFNHENALSLDRMNKIPGLQVLRFPNDVVREFRKAAPGVMQDAVAGDKVAEEVLKSYSAYLRQQLRWAEFSDRAYWQARYT